MPQEITAATAPPRLLPTRITVMLQDPSVNGSPIDVAQISLEPNRERLASKDFVLTEPLQPNHEGEYVFEAKDVSHFLPASILGNLQRNFDLFMTYCDDIPPNWSSGEPKLPIYPDWDMGFNCFYSNGHSADMHAPGVYFCHGVDRLSQETVYAGLSGELVAHEEGHAILDRFRPRYNDPGVWSFEGSAFHEAFGDVFSILVQLKDPRIVARVIAQTGGDLRKHNLVSDIAEQFGTGMNHNEEVNGGPPDYNGGPWLRTAINDFVWADPDTLPQQLSQPNQLWAEAHSFSQLWTGATYDMLTSMTRQLMEQGLPAEAALAQADEDMLRLYGKLVSRTAPNHKFAFRDVAHSLLEADKLLGGKWGGLIQQVMEKRRILKAPTPLGQASATYRPGFDL